MMETKKLTHDEMLKRLEDCFKEPVTMTWFQGYYECYLPGGDAEDAEFAKDMVRSYPNLCAGGFDQGEWDAFVAEMFLLARDCHPNFTTD